MLEILASFPPSSCSPRHWQGAGNKRSRALETRTPVGEHDITWQGLQVAMQSPALLGSSSLGLETSSRHSAPKCRPILCKYRPFTSDTAFAVKQASHTRDSRPTSAAGKFQAGRDDTIRALDSLLGSTDDVDLKQDEARQLASSSSSSSVSAFTSAPAAVDVSSSRPQGDISRDFQGSSAQARSALIAFGAVLDFGCSI